MKIERHDVGAAHEQVVVHGDTVYLAGIVADNPKGKSITEQTKDILGQIDGFLAKAGTDKIEAAVGQYLDHRHGQFRRDERGVGRLGVARQYAGARHRRGQARHAGLQGRDHGGGGQVIPVWKNRHAFDFAPLVAAGSPAPAVRWTGRRNTTSPSAITIRMAWPSTT